jgi:hypothetical protein
LILLKPGTHAAVSRGSEFPQIKVEDKETETKNKEEKEV